MDDVKPDWDEIDELWDEIGPALVDRLYDLPADHTGRVSLPVSDLVQRCRDSGNTKAQLSQECKAFITDTIRDPFNSDSDELQISHEVERIFRNNFSAEVIGDIFENLNKYPKGLPPTPTPPRPDNLPRHPTGNPSQYLPKYGDRIQFLVDNPEMIGNPPNALIVYTVTVSTDQKNWSDICFPGSTACVKKRYNDFEYLWHKIKEWNQLQGHPKWDFHFASKSLFYRFKPTVVQARMENFNDLLSRLVEKPELVDQPFVKNWFSKQESFTHLNSITNNTAPLSFIAPQ